MFPCAACHSISPRPHSIVYQAVLIVLFSFKQKVARPVLGKIAYRLRVKAVLRSPKSQQVASRCAGTLKKVCKAVVAKKGAHSGF